MRTLEARLVRLERQQREDGGAALREALARCGQAVPTGGDMAGALAALDDAALEWLVDHLSMGCSPAQRRREQAWIEALSDADLDAVIAGTAPRGAGQ